MPYCETGESSVPTEPLLLLTPSRTNTPNCRKWATALSQYWCSLLHDYT